MFEMVLSAPGKNALSTAVLDDLRRQISQARGEPLLLSGAGDAVCAGLNLKEVATLDLDGARRLLRSLEALVEALFEHPAPTVALVNGHAIAGGCILALCCDHRVAASDPGIRIGLNETALGLPFPPRVLAVVRSRVPAGALDRVILEAGLHPPAQARELGLVDVVADDARTVALAALERLSSHPRDAYARNKARLHAGVLALAVQDRAAEEELAGIWGSAEVRARAAAALQGKR